MSPLPPFVVLSPETAPRLSPSTSPSRRAPSHNAPPPAHNLPKLWAITRPALWLEGVVMTRGALGGFSAAFPPAPKLWGSTGVAAGTGRLRRNHKA
jgi:hypothetical protein